MFGKKKDKAPKAEIYQEPPAPEYRSVSALYIIISALYIISGILLIVFPSVTILSLGRVFAACMCAYGIARIIIYFTNDHFTGIMQQDLTVGVTVGALGTFMLLHQDFVETVFPFAISILLLVGAISKLQYSIDLKRLGAVHWNIYLVFALIMFALGVIMLCKPFDQKPMYIIITVSLILEGVLNIVAVLWISSRIKKNGSGSFRVNRVEAPSSIIPDDSGAAKEQRKAITQDDMRS